MPVTKVLSGHTSPETAYLVEDYPYGFRLRCQIRYWVETNKHGSRVVSQTTNPKKPGTVWNKPKASTYSPIRVLFLDENDHVQNAALSFYDDDKIDGFVSTYGEGLTEADKRLIDYFKRAVARRAAMKSSLTTTP